MARETDDPQTERQELLERIWMAEARAFAAILEGTDPKELPAALLNTARQFLSDQGIRLETLEKDQRRGKAAGSMADDIARAVAADKAAALVPLPAPED